MSNEILARRAAVQVCFEGTEITEDIRPYLTSVTYTDSEEDESDSLQIQLQDRDGIWLEDWLTKAVQATAAAKLSMSSVIVPEHWGNSGTLPTGRFELDSVEAGGPPYTVHNRHNGNALTEFTGLDPDKITFDIQLLMEMGVDPMEEITKLWNYERTGATLPLTVGTHCYGRYRWNVISHEVTVKYTDRRGDIAGAVVSVTLQEYLRDGQATPGIWNYQR